mmetsp:Transcript_36453/g.66792  ORF Transcript_36453/g.66792 Transcript_36453/m.66792 type:complete len:311 (+) Transcript_36453:30-962(+)
MARQINRQQETSSHDIVSDTVQNWPELVLRLRRCHRLAERPEEEFGGLGPHSLAFWLGLECVRRLCERIGAHIFLRGLLGDQLHINSFGKPELAKLGSLLGCNFHHSLHGSPYLLLGHLRLLSCLCVGLVQCQRFRLRSRRRLGLLGCLRLRCLLHFSLALGLGGRWGCHNRSCCSWFGHYCCLLLLASVCFRFGIVCLNISAFCAPYVSLLLGLCVRLVHVREIHGVGEVARADDADRSSGVVLSCPVCREDLLHLHAGILLVRVPAWRFAINAVRDIVLPLDLPRRSDRRHQPIHPVCNRWIAGIDFS